MTTRARDSSVGSISRNKENDPLTGREPRQQFIPSLSKSPDKNEFFTDTLLDNSDASQHSLIPLPKYSKDNPSHPRKKIRSVIPPRNSKLPLKHRATQSELPAFSAHDLKNSSARTSGRDSSPFRSTGLSTPPRSRDGSSIASPLDTFSSPPRALTETYERIDQEEDLAATEGEISDPEEYHAEEKENQLRMNGGFSTTKQVVTDSPGRLPRSRGSTPTSRALTHHTPRAKEVDLTTVSVLSDPTGMSFVRELSNTNLQLALTPLVLESARDRKALEQAWIYKKPVAFSKAGRTVVDNLDLPDASPVHENIPSRRLIPFSKAGRIRLASDLMTRPPHHRTFSDSTQKLSHNRNENNDSSHGDKRRSHEALREDLYLKSRPHRENFFPQNHGFPARDTSTKFAARGIHGDETDVRISEDNSPNNSVSVQRQPERSKDHIYGIQEEDQGTTEIDWVHMGADKVITTIENSPTISTNDHLSETHDLLNSPEKSRRFDVDFTGQSFQVSESPPVRSKVMAKDYSTNKEIEGLAKQALTTNRLTQLRARESHEHLWRSPRSPAVETVETDRLKGRSWRSSSFNGEKPSDTPIVNFRTSLPNGIGRHPNMSEVQASLSGDRSHDILQRLARGSSSTSRSSTPSEKLPTTDVMNADHEEFVGLDDQAKLQGREKASFKPESERASELVAGTEFKPGFNISRKTVQQTPKVIGAWMDTVLPDTVRPSIRNGQTSKHMQTPHVSTGGWIETPAPNVQSAKLDPVIEAIQEVPEELMDGIVKDKMTTAKDDEIEKPATDRSGQAASVGGQSAVDGSLAKKVLIEAKGKVRSKQSEFGLEIADHTDHSAPDDTLALGSATVQSLENFLDMDETELTILSRIGEEPLGPTETEVIYRLASKLDRLRSHIHDAKRGLSNLEHQISQPHQMDELLPSPPAEQEVKATCSNCMTTKPAHPASEQDLETETAIIPTKSTIPFTLLALTIPIPVLFRPRAAAAVHRTSIGSIRTRLPQPTPLGWLVLAIWSWYALECTLCEIYSRPQYASRYSWPVLQEPEFPFVLPTMLYRWSRLSFLRSYIFQPFLGFFAGVFRIIAMWLGVTDGFVDALPMPSAAGGMYQQQGQVRDVYAAGPGINAGGGGGGVNMMNDEFL